MIDFEIRLQADELLHGDYEIMSLISKIMLSKFLWQFKTKLALPPSKGLKTPCCQGNVSASTDLAL